MPATKSFLLNPSYNLKEAVWAFSALLIIALINLMQQWEERKISVEHSTAELQCTLKLDASQTVKMQEITYEYYDQMAKAYSKYFFNTEKCEDEVRQLQKRREQTVFKVLNANQRATWQHLYTSCNNVTTQ
ncbi:MAG TPA: hypothetical protein VIN08_24625 [Ohtaekwangia sp.]|uniref:hypothetical protein n=1 Tax=Ohtaekwangia sp. TaxID=2066019 RepID=UPI002F94AFD7